MAITDWAIEDRPRDKLLAKGAEALTDAELLAIFLRTGIKGKSAVDLARELLEETGGLASLLSANEKSFCQSKGLGQAKYVQMKAVVEMSRRYLEEKMKRGDAELFRGTIDAASVHPREIIRQVLHHNAAAIVLSHNHPSGIPEPSQADIAITQKIKSSLEIIDVRLLDHFIIGDKVVSFAEKGLL